MHDDKRDPLNLAGLPQPEPPPGDPWPAIAAALQRQRRRRLGGWAAVAAVALSFGLAWQVLQQTPPQQPDSQIAAERAVEPTVRADIPSVEPSSPDADRRMVEANRPGADTSSVSVIAFGTDARRGDEIAAGSDTQPADVGQTGAEARQRDGASPPDADTIATLVGLSQQLESRLRGLRAEAGMLPADTLMYQVELEDLVVQVDDALSRRPDSRALWSQRVNLLLDLNQLYHQELRREQLPIASL